VSTEDSEPVVRARKSAFAAAFLSFIYPGLGHAYLGRGMRALAWAVLPTLALAAGAGLVVSSFLWSPRSTPFGPSPFQAVVREQLQEWGEQPLQWLDKPDKGSPNPYADLDLSRPWPAMGVGVEAKTAQLHPHDRRDGRHLDFVG